MSAEVGVGMFVGKVGMVLSYMAIIQFLVYCEKERRRLTLSAELT